MDETSLEKTSTMSDSNVELHLAKNSESSETGNDLGLTVDDLVINGEDHVQIGDLDVTMTHTKEVNDDINSAIPVSSAPVLSASDDSDVDPRNVLRSPPKLHPAVSIDSKLEEKLDLKVLPVGRMKNTPAFLSIIDTPAGKSVRSTRSSIDPSFAAKQRSFLNKVHNALSHFQTDDTSSCDSDSEALLNENGRHASVSETAQIKRLSVSGTLNHGMKRRREDMKGKIVLELDEEMTITTNGSNDTNRKDCSPVKMPRLASEIHDTSNSEKTKDNFCWYCHREGIQLTCTSCPRAYHLRCFRRPVVTSSPNGWVCPECLTILKAESSETRSKALKMLSLDQLCSLLRFAVERMKTCTGADVFEVPVDNSEFPLYKDYVINPMSLSDLEQNINRRMYGSTEAFYADASWILHNCVIFNTYQSKLTPVARNIMRTCKQEIAEIENCPDCYEHAYTCEDNWFIQVCRKPHLLVWAKLKGFPYWPAKAMRSNADGGVDVRFFGAHDRAWVPSRDCFLYSQENPNSINKQLQQQQLKKKNNNKNSLETCIEEVGIHIQLLQEKFEEFKYAPAKTQFDPKKANEQLKMMLPKYDAADAYEMPCHPISPQRKRVRKSSQSNKSTDGKTSEIQVDLSNAPKNLKCTVETPPPPSALADANMIAEQRLKKKDARKIGLVDRIQQKLAMLTRSDTPPMEKLDSLKEKESESSNKDTAFASNEDSSVLTNCKKSIKDQQRKEEVSDLDACVQNLNFSRGDQRLLVEENESVMKSSGVECKTENLCDTSLSSDAMDPEDAANQTGESVGLKIQQVCSGGAAEQLMFQPKVMLTKLVLDESEGNVDRKHCVSVNSTPEKLNGEGSRGQSDTEENKDILSSPVKSKLDVVLVKERRDELNSEIPSELSDREKNKVILFSPEVKSGLDVVLVKKSTGEEVSSDRGQTIAFKRKSTDEIRPDSLTISKIPKEEDISIKTEILNNNTTELPAQSNSQSSDCVVVDEKVNSTDRPRFRVLSPSSLGFKFKSIPKVQDAANGSKTLFISPSPQWKKLSSNNNQEQSVSITIINEDSSQKDSGPEQSQIKVRNLFPNSGNLSSTSKSVLKTVPVPISLLASKVVSSSGQQVPSENVKAKTMNVQTLCISANPTNGSQVKMPLATVRSPPVSCVLQPVSTTVFKPSNASTSTSDATTSTIQLPISKLTQGMLQGIKPTMLTSHSVTISAAQPVTKCSTVLSVTAPPSTLSSNVSMCIPIVAHPITQPVTVAASVRPKACKAVSETIVASSVPSLIPSAVPSLLAASQAPSNTSGTSGSFVRRILPRAIPIASLATTGSVVSGSSVLRDSTLATSTSSFINVSELVASNRASSPDFTSPNTGQVPQTIISSIRSVPPLSKPTPNVVKSLGTSEARSGIGPVSTELRSKAGKLTEMFMGAMQECLKDMGSMGNVEAQVRCLQLDLEHMQWRHQQEIDELRHNTELVIAEVRESLKLEAQQAVAEVLAGARTEKEAAVAAAKRRQWCAHCSKEALFYCCWNTSYCGYSCQQSDWPVHSLTCTQGEDSTPNLNKDSRAHQPATAAGTATAAAGRGGRGAGSRSRRIWKGLKPPPLSPLKR